MTTDRSCGIAALLVAAGLALAGCASAKSADVGLAKVASVAADSEDTPGVITLAPAAVKRLGVQTAPVTARATGLTVPYGALVYEADGSSWVFVETAPLHYRRAPIAVSGISGDRVALTSGPPVGTRVVTVGAPELVGVETGIDGEE